MIRFMQQSAAFKKYALTAILIVICIAMAWYLVPTFTGQGMGLANTNNAVATVSGEEVSPDAVRKEATRELEQQFPKGGAQARSLLPFFAQRAYQQLVNQKILLVESRRLGLRATEDDVREYIEHGPYAATFFPGGKFVGMEQYETLLSQANLTKEQFEREVADEILLHKLEALVTAPATVTEAQVRQAFEKQNTKVKFDYAVIKKEDLLKSLHPTEAELQAYYDRNKQAYVNSIPEKRQLKYVVLDNARMLAQTQVTQQELDAYYDQHRDQYRVPEQVNVRHILIKTPLAGPDGKVDQKAVDAAQAKAEDVLKQVNAGGNFAELAKKYSEDPGSAKEGGSLGWIGRGRTVPEFEKAAFSLPKGGTSDLVKSSYGFHIIHVDDKQDAHMKSLAEVKDQIEPILKQQKAAQAAQREADQLTAQARSEGLEKAAAAKGLQVITTDFVTSHDTLPGIGNDQQFMNAAFAQEKNAPPDLAGLHSGFAVYQVTAIKPPSTPTFAEIRDRVETEFKTERAGQLLTQKTQELSDRAKADHDLKKAAKEAGAQFKTSDFVAPDGQVPDIGSVGPQSPASVAFTLKPGEISGPIDNGNTGAVLSVLERQAPTEQDFAAKKDQIRDSLTQEKQQELFALFLSSLHDKMQKSGEIKVNQKELDLLTKARSEEE